MSEIRRKNSCSETPRPQLGSLPNWRKIEHRLRLGWSPEKIVEWHQKRFPGEPQPSARALARFLRDKQTSWFVVSLTVGSFTPSPVSQIPVLREQASLIEVQKLRLNKLLAMEVDTGQPLPEVRHNIALLFSLYASHLTAQQGLGLRPAYHRGRRPTTHSARSAERKYPFLTPEEDRYLVELEERVNRGEIDIIELYRLSSALFDIESGRRPRAEQPGGTHDEPATT